jgi:predicted lipid-binding transport protein (Tim44 family)
MKAWTLILAAVLAAASVEAEAAKRLGGGQSIGRQSGNVTQRDAGAAPAAPAQQAQRAPTQQPGAAAAPQPARSGIGGMVAGLAAGLGLAWLAHSLGLGAAFGTVLMFILLGVVLMAVIGFVMRSRRPAPALAGGYPAQAMGGTPEAPAPPRQYNPDKIGNDASARPWERSSMAFEPAKITPASNVRIGGGLAGPQGWGVPQEFDTDGFLAAAKRNFTTLQEAWDKGDVATLRSMMTDEMLAEIRRQLAEREAQGAAGSRTDVVMLEAQLLGIEELDDEYMASVEFSGMMREDPSAGPAPFREVWNMVKPKSGGSGWLVGGVQALQ